MMNFRNKTNIVFFAALLFVAISCTKDDILKVEEQNCDVTISGFSFAQEGEGGGLKGVDINRQTDDTPEGVGGYTVNVYFPVDATSPYTSEEFNFVHGGAEDYGKISNVKVGSNRFVAESFGGNQYCDWYDIERSNVKNDKNKIKDYLNKLKVRYPVYSLYRGVVDINIRKNIDNAVRFSMQPVSGRLSVVVENNKSKNALKVIVNGMEKEVFENEVYCYILNDDSQNGTELDITIEFYKYDHSEVGIAYYSYYKKEKITNVDLKIETGKNKIRLINVE